MSYFESICCAACFLGIPPCSLGWLVHVRGPRPLLRWRGSCYQNFRSVKLGYWGTHWIHVCYIYLHEWLICMVNVGIYTLDGSYGLRMKWESISQQMVWVGGFRYSFLFIFTPIPWKMIQFDEQICFKWVVQPPTRQMVNWWFGSPGGSVRIGIPLRKNPLHKGIQGIQTTGTQTTNEPLVDHTHPRNKRYSYCWWKNFRRSPLDMVDVQLFTGFIHTSAGCLPTVSHQRNVLKHWTSLRIPIFLPRET